MQRHRSHAIQTPRHQAQWEDQALHMHHMLQTGNSLQQAAALPRGKLGLTACQHRLQQPFHWMARHAMESSWGCAHSHPHACWLACQTRPCAAGLLLWTCAQAHKLLYMCSHTKRACTAYQSGLCPAAVRLL